MEKLASPFLGERPAEIRKGRVVEEGYARGWGLQFGDLKEVILQDPLYQEALQIAWGRTVVSEANRMNIFLILKYFLGSIPRGHLVEFGSYRGGNALFMAHVVKRLHPGVMVFACDTYTGMPATDAAIDAHREGDFQDVDLQELETFAKTRELDNLQFVRGLFQDTAPSLLPTVGHVALAHIDCDIYSAVRYSYDAVKPFMVPGGYFVFDDATVSSCIGATEAVEEVVISRDGLHSEQIYPHFVFRHPFAAEPAR